MILRPQAAHLAVFLIASLPMSAAGQLVGGAPQKPKPPAPIVPRVLVVDPAPAPVPALKYRLLPSIADLNPGDAAPIYLRLHGYEDRTLEPHWQQVREKYQKWTNMPVDQFPKAEARAFVDRFVDKLRQLEFGTRRQACDWNYTLPEQRLNGINIMLPDVQSMREWGRVLGIKARVEIAEKQYDEAVRTIETGIAFARHVADGPFLINGLVGLAGATILLDEVEELIARPGAPNLYWALTLLPRPLIDFRHEIENEQKLVENMIPELTEAGSDQPRTAAEWASLVSRMHTRIVNWARIYKGEKWLDAIATADLERFKAVALPPARAYLPSHRRPSDPPLSEMSDDQAIALYMARGYREVWDDHFKNGYLPMREARHQFAASSKRLAAARSGPLILFVSTVPSIESVMRSNLRTDRHVAALRVIEAIRLHAASHDGKVPESLDQITEVPVPDDPATGEPFIYRAADSAAILHGLRADLPYPPPTYRIRIRR